MWCRCCGSSARLAGHTPRGEFGWGSLVGGVVRRLLLCNFAGWVDVVHIRNGRDIALGSDPAEMAGGPV